MNELKSVRQSNVCWILKWFIAAGDTNNFIEINEFPKYIKFWCRESNRTVILNTKDDHHLIHFIEGTQEKHSDYFTKIIGFDLVVTASAELIIQFLDKGTSKKSIDQHLKSFNLLKEELILNSI